MIYWHRPFGLAFPRLRNPGSTAELMLYMHNGAIFYTSRKNFTTNFIQILLLNLLVVEETTEKEDNRNSRITQKQAGVC